MRNPALRWALVPFYLLALPTAAKSFRDNPIIGSRRLNGFGLHVTRLKFAHEMTRLRRNLLRHVVEEKDIVDFERDGFLLKRDFLPAAEFAALRKEVFTLKAPAREMIQGDTVTRRLALDHKALGRLPATRRMVNSATWRGPINYVGSTSASPLLYLQAIFSRAGSGEPDPQTHLHADTFHSTVKAWLFLADVGKDESPLMYVPGSHRPTRQRLDWERRMSLSAAADCDYLTSRGSPRITPNELYDLGLPDPVAFAVPANTLVVADTFGFHARGVSARPSVRFEIWAYGRRNPFLPFVGLSPLDLPLLEGRAVPLMWRTLDVAEKFRLKRNPWRPIGEAQIDQPVGDRV